MSAAKQIDGYILAGGKSSRMGTDKGLLKVNNRFLIEFAIDHLRNCVDRIFLCTGNPEYVQFGLELVPDKIQEEGPASAIATALQHAIAPKLFVLSCDTPFIGEVIIQRIISFSEGAEITVPLVKNRIEPLCGVYASSCKDKWKEQFDGGVRKMQTLIEHFNFKTLDGVSEIKADEMAFMNINSPEDFEIAKKQLRWV
ncbi:MAG: molybdenum cofactor guanylyltransferase [Bacteroidetes bacterium]|nr:molybdenum cofactor guanylyltransferase [Bacteroidota bacterium]